MTIHMLEPGGRGGVFQHSVAVADLLADTGREVILHTAGDAELQPERATFCGCVSWERWRPDDSLRRAIVLWRYLTRTVPHLARLLDEDDALHTQGRFKPGLLALPLLAARVRGARTVASPHNLFERDKRRIGRVSLRAELKLAQAVLVFSDADRARAAQIGSQAQAIPLLMRVPAVQRARVESWRAGWGASREAKIALCPGQVRPDKRHDLAVRALAELPSSWKLAVVGEDLGAGEKMLRLADRLGVEVIWNDAYVQADDFVAAIAAADIVLCPYEVASQSAVLAMARQLGVPSVASDVGGLGELATATADPADPRRFAAACVAAVGERTDAGEDAGIVLEAHQLAYRS